MEKNQQRKQEETKNQTAGQSKDKLQDDTEMVIEASEELEVVKSFDELGIREELLRGIYAYGFNKPSAVQQRAILPIIKGRDVIVQSQSGTGKTCVFTVGGLQSVDL